MRECVGGYRVLANLGSGGSADVFLARRGRLGPLVALKCLKASCASDPEVRSTFVDEGRVLARLRHPNVVRLYESGCDGGVYFHAIEYVRGPTLAHVLARLRVAGELPPVEAAVAVAQSVLSALHAAHELEGDDGAPLELVHRDVSPHNVILTTRGEVRLADFGLARFREQSHRTLEGVLRGRAEYLSPEQLYARFDRRADVWAAALVLYESLSLCHPFEGRDELESVMRVGHCRVPSLAEVRPGLPHALCEVVELALARPVESRFETAQVFREAIGCAAPVANPKGACRTLVRLAFPDGWPAPTGAAGWRRLLGGAWR